jgi:hypothetical protein
MSAILTPALALRYLQELSTDVRAAVVLDAHGALAAGEAAAVAPARALVAALDAAAGPSGRELIVRLHERGTVAAHALAARGDAGDALVVAAGPHALLDLLRHDIAQALRDLGAGGGPHDAREDTADSRAAAASDGGTAAERLLVPLLGGASAAAVVDASGRVAVLGAGDSAARAAIAAARRLVAAAPA